MHKNTDSVRIVLFNPDSIASFPIVTEADDPDNWKLPGGKFNSGDEKPEDAATREISEELGLGGIALHNAAVLQNNDGHSSRYIYTGLVEPGQVMPPVAELTDPDAITQVMWVTAETVPEGKNKEHIIAAAAAARVALTTVAAERILSA